MIKSSDKSYILVQEIIYNIVTTHDEYVLVYTCTNGHIQQTSDDKNFRLFGQLCIYMSVDWLMYDQVMFF